MNVSLNYYEGCGNGLRDNPHIKQITRVVPVLGLDAVCNEDLDFAKAKTEKNAETFLLIRAHLHGVDFFTDLITDSNYIPIEIDNTKFYYFSQTKCALGHIGEFENPVNQLERRKQQINEARNLIASLKGYDKQMYQRLYKLSDIALNNLKVIGSSLP